MTPGGIKLLTNKILHEVRMTPIGYYEKIEIFVRIVTNISSYDPHQMCQFINYEPQVLYLLMDYTLRVTIQY